MVAQASFLCIIIFKPGVWNNHSEYLSNRDSQGKWFLGDSYTILKSNSEIFSFQNCQTNQKWAELVNHLWRQFNRGSQYWQFWHDSQVNSDMILILESAKNCSRINLTLDAAILTHNPYLQILLVILWWILNKHYYKDHVTTRSNS